MKTALLALVLAATNAGAALACDETAANTTSETGAITVTVSPDKTPLLWFTEGR